MTKTNLLPDEIEVYHDKFGDLLAFKEFDLRVPGTRYVRADLVSTPNKPAEVDLDDLRVPMPDHDHAFSMPCGQCLKARIINDHIDSLAASGHIATGKGGDDETDYSEHYRPERLEYTMCGKIYARHKDGTRHMFMDVRGWGHLTGNGAKALPHDVATGIQDAWAKEVVDLWNNKSKLDTEQQKTAEPDDNTQIWQTIQSRQDQTQPAAPTQIDAVVK